MSSVVRAFVGLNLPFYLSTQLSAIAADIAQHDRSRMSWVAEDNYHVTLSFVGEQSMRWLEDLAEEIDRSVDLFSPELYATEISPFPQGSPKLLAALLAANDPLVRMQKQIKAATEKLNHIPERKRFRPHVTLARKFPRSGELTIPALGHDMRDHATQLCIYESQLSSSGANYYPIFDFNLS